MYKMVDGNFGEENTGEYTILKEVAIWNQH
jgi:hypothetical protein